MEQTGVIPGSNEDLAIQVTTKYIAGAGRNARLTGTLRKAYIDGATWMRDRLLPIESKENADKYSEALEWMAMLYFQLHELVELKKIKDTEGKTQDYLDRQPKAWHGANMVLDLWKKSDYGAIPMKPITQQKKDEAIAFLDNIRDYERENGEQICYDERTSEELYKIFIDHNNNIHNGTT